ncbi:MAG: PspC domain-containing protein [Parcubacteria group bacterium]
MNTEETKRLYRSENNKVFAGVCGGLGEYFAIDPVLIRLVWLLVVIFSGVVPGLVAYIFAIFIIPKKGK